MKKIISIVAITIIVTGCVPITPTSLTTTQNVTPLELKMMQTRKFMKPAIEVASAIKTGGLDSGANCAVQQEYDVKTPEGKTLRYVKLWCGRDISNQKKTAKPTLQDAIIGNIMRAGRPDMTSQNQTTMQTIDYEVVGDKSATVVRMRINEGILGASSTKMASDMITDPAAYAAEFKRIGDSVFVQGIEINPAEQN